MAGVPNSMIQFNDAVSGINTVPMRVNLLWIIAANGSVTVTYAPTSTGWDSRMEFNNVGPCFLVLNPIHAKTDEIGKRQHEWFHKRLLGLTSVIQSHSWFSRYGLNLFDCFVEAAMRIPNLQALRTHSVPSQTNLTVLHGLDRPLLLVSTQRVVIRWKTKSLYQQPFRRCNGNPQQR